MGVIHGGAYIRSFTAFYSKTKFGKMYSTVYYYISSENVFIAQGIWNAVMKHQRPYRFALVLWTSYTDPKYLATNLLFNVGFDSDGLFFRFQRSTFNLVNKNAYVKEIFLFTTWLDPLTPELFFQLCISQGYIENFERIYKNSICIKVNNFAKF